MRILHSLPNALSLARLALSALLLVARNDVLFFMGLYLFLVATDVLDGYLARKYHCTSVLGSRLDSLADGLFFLILMILVLPLLISHPVLLLLILLITALRLITLIMTKLRTHSFSVMHTIANKATGVAVLILVPFFLFYSETLLFGYILCIIALLSAGEELLLLIVRESYDPDEKGFLFPKRS